MNQYQFKLGNGDNTIGTVYRPNTFDQKLPVVIYCHGWGSDRTLGPSTHRLCSALMASSAALVSFDFFGCGETGGAYSQMTYGRWVANLRDVFEWVSEQAWVNPKAIGCFSISSGTTAALRFAEDSAEVAFVVSIATCLGPFIGMPDGPARLLVEHWDSLVNGGTVDVFGVPFGIDFFKDFLGHAPVYHLKAIRCPIFFLQGSADNLYRRSDAWLGYQLMQKNGLSAKYLEIEGGDHSLDDVPDQCAEEVIKWLKEIRVLG